MAVCVWAGGGREMGGTFQDLVCARISSLLQTGGGLCHVLAMPRELWQLLPSALESHGFDTLAMLENAG